MKLDSKRLEIGCQIEQNSRQTSRPIRCRRRVFYGETQNCLPLVTAGCLASAQQTAISAMNRPVSLRSVTPTPANTHSRHASAQQARHDEAATPTPTTATATATATATTVQSLHPHPTVPLNENVSVVQAAAYMAAKRQDAILVVDNSGELTGILTDKDIAYRVVAEALSPKATPIAAVMTMNPVSVTTESNAADALNKMVAGRFRHLPVVEDMDDDDNDLDLDFAGGLEDAATTLESLRALKASASASPTPATVFAVLDITKALYEALERIERIYDPDATLRAQQDFNDLQFQLAQQQIQHDMQHDQLSLPQHMRSSSTISAAAAALHFIQGLRDQLACPSLAMLIAKDSLNAPMISVTATVLDAVKLMKQAKETAVLVFEPLLADPSRPSGDLAGIFTTKDLVLRVLAAGLDPAKTPVSRVMTPHPDCVHPDTSIIDALKKIKPLFTLAHHGLARQCLRHGRCPQAHVYHSRRDCDHARGRGGRGRRSNVEQVLGNRRTRPPWRSRHRQPRRAAFPVALQRRRLGNVVSSVPLCKPASAVAACGRQAGRMGG
ncbi:hypothetical protein BC831DRAFT_16780 [Entophlyctis helioformis]|nr:hypothetical protein BC831DRAFT_16780 [Entophlyctis helioformis]